MHHIGNCYHFKPTIQSSIYTRLAGSETKHGDGHRDRGKWDSLVVDEAPVGTPLGD
jgi:hypothetical protein